MLFAHNSKSTSWAADNIASANTPFLSTSENHTSIPFIIWFCRKSNCFLGF